MTGQSPPSVYLNGRIVPARDAAISVADTGFLHGASAFTTMLAHNGVVFRLGRHIERLMKTVEALELRTDATEESLTGAVQRVLDANGLREARMRVTLTPGSASGGETTTLVTAEPLPEYPPEWYEEGLTVVVTETRQLAGNLTFGHKTGCYFPRVLALKRASAKGAQEALWFTTDNRLAEACFCNVFLVLDGKVFTPPQDTPVLPGVVREAVVELCAQLALECDDRTPLTEREMLSAREMFLTASCSGIRPVARVETHAVGDEKPGPITRKIMSAYLERVERECPG